MSFVTFERALLTHIAEAGRAPHVWLHLGFRTEQSWDDLAAHHHGVGILSMIWRSMLLAGAKADGTCTVYAVFLDKV